MMQILGNLSREAKQFLPIREAVVGGIHRDRLDHSWLQREPEADIPKKVNKPMGGGVPFSSDKRKEAPHESSQARQE